MCNIEILMLCGRGWLGGVEGMQAESPQVQRAKG